jgi:general secretion pathway protein G
MAGATAVTASKGKSGAAAHAANENATRDRILLSRRSDGGFTLLELIVVISMMLLLLGIAVPIYTQSIITQREYNLRHNLRTLNQAIDRYTLDKKKAPESLDDLKTAGYIEFVPEDITGRTDTWVLEKDDAIKTLEQTDPGVTGVHSGSDKIGSDGRAYSDW